MRNTSVLFSCQGPVSVTFFKNSSAGQIKAFKDPVSSDGNLRICRRVSTSTFYSVIRFQKHLNALQSFDGTFASYLLTNWLTNQRQWAFHAQINLLLLGNRTNNRPENANMQLKKVTNARDRLPIAIQKIWMHGATVIREYSMLATYGCERRLIANVDDQLRPILDRMTGYAAKRVMRHVNRTVPHLRWVYMSDTEAQVIQSSVNYTVNTQDGSCNCNFYQSMWLPCMHIIAIFRDRQDTQVPIRARWTTAYNEPMTAINNLLPVDSGCSPSYSCELAALRASLSGLRQLDEGRCVEMMRAFRKQLSTAANESQNLAVIRGVESSAHQPRWQSASKRQKPASFELETSGTDNGTRHCSPTSNTDELRPSDAKKRIQISFYQ